MLLVLILFGVAWLGWWLVTRHFPGFPAGFAELLERTETRGLPVSLLTGRSYVTGWFRGRAVELKFQRAGEHQTGHALISMVAAASDRETIRARSRPGHGDLDRELERALFTLEGTHALKLSVDTGRLRAMWQPAGLFFPGRFDPGKWREVLAAMHVVASRLEHPAADDAARTSAGTGVPDTGSEGGLPLEAAQAGRFVPASAVAPTPADVPDAGDWHSLPPSRLGFRGPVLLLRLLAALLMLVSLSMLLASASLVVATGTFAGPVRLSGIFAAILLTSSTAAFVLSGRRGLLVNERGPVPAAADAAVGGWLWLLLATLLALPLWMVVWLAPLVTWWRDVLQFLDENDVWEMAQGAPEFSGLVLLPVFAFLSVPALELATSAGFVAGAVVLAMLLGMQSPLFPRAFLLVVLLQAGLVLSAQWAALATTSAMQALAAEFFAGPDSADLVGAITRYGEVVRQAANTLTWVLLGWAAWIPTLFYSRRVQTTFAAPE